jgi:hypothetical protein
MGRPTMIKRRMMAVVKVATPSTEHRSGGRLPAFRPVQLANHVPTGDRWLHEMKYDGYRCLIAVGGGEMTFELAPRRHVGATSPELSRPKVGRMRGPCVHAFPVRSKLSLPRCNNLRMLLLLDFSHICLLLALRHGITDPRLCRECLRCQFANAPC